MPKLKDPPVEAQMRESLQPQQQALRDRMEQMQQLLQANTQAMLHELRQQPGADANAIDKLEQSLDGGLETLDRQRRDLASAPLDPDLAEQIGAALDDPGELTELASSLDQKSERAREQLAGLDAQLKQAANDPRASDEAFVNLDEMRNAAQRQLEGYEAARAAAQIAQTLCEAERALEGVHSGVDQQQSSRAALDQLRDTLDATSLHEQQVSVSDFIKNHVPDHNGLYFAVNEASGDAYLGIAMREEGGIQARWQDPSHEKIRNLLKDPNTEVYFMKIADTALDLADQQKSAKALEEFTLEQMIEARDDLLYLNAERARLSIAKMEEYMDEFSPRGGDIEMFTVGDPTNKSRVERHDWTFAWDEDLD